MKTGWEEFHSTFLPFFMKW